MNACVYWKSSDMQLEMITGLLAIVCIVAQNSQSRRPD